MKVILADFIPRIQIKASLPNIKKKKKERKKSIPSCLINCYKIHEALSGLGLPSTDKFD